MQGGGSAPQQHARPASAPAACAVDLSTSPRRPLLGSGDGEVDYKEFVDVLARETVTLAAMGKRGMQAKEAMGVDDLEEWDKTQRVKFDGFNSHRINDLNLDDLTSKDRRDEVQIGPRRVGKGGAGASAQQVGSVGVSVEARQAPQQASRGAAAPPQRVEASSGNAAQKTRRASSAHHIRPRPSPQGAPQPPVPSESLRPGAPGPREVPPAVSSLADQRPGGMGRPASATTLSSLTSYMRPSSAASSLVRGGSVAKLEAERAARRAAIKNSDFVRAASDAMNMRFQPKDMFKAFQYVDVDRSGKLGKKELAHVLDLWNIPFDGKQLDDLVFACDAECAAPSPLAFLRVLGPVPIVRPASASGHAPRNAAADHARTRTRGSGDGEVDYKEFVDVLARETVTLAAMGKRGMQAKEAMGVDDLEEWDKTQRVKFDGFNSHRINDLNLDDLTSKDRRDEVQIGPRRVGKGH